MSAGRHCELLASLPIQPIVAEAEFCRESLHRTLAHLVASQRAWLPILHSLIQGRARCGVKEHPTKLMTTAGLTTATWEALVSEHHDNSMKWDELMVQVSPELRINIGHRSWNIAELTDRLINHERHHLAEHKLVTLDEK